MINIINSDEKHKLVHWYADLKIFDPPTSYVWAIPRKTLMERNSTCFSTHSFHFSAYLLWNSIWYVNFTFLELLWTLLITLFAQSQVYMIFFLTIIFCVLNYTQVYSSVRVHLSKNSNSIKFVKNYLFYFTSIRNHLAYHYNPIHVVWSWMSRPRWQSLPSFWWSEMLDP